MNENVIAGNVRGIRKRDAFTCWDEARRFDQWGVGKKEFIVGFQ